MLKNIPLSTTIHFVGICGIGMSGLACFLSKLGYNVQGSDCNIENNITFNNLTTNGVNNIFSDHRSEYVKQADIVIYSSAIPLYSNPEICEAKKLGIRLLSRAKLLNEISKEYKSIIISGTHGKTTTSALVENILCNMEVSPNIITGGIIGNYNSSINIGEGNIMVIEADESDGSMQTIIGDIVLVTNMEMEHINYYTNEEKLLDSFRHFITNEHLMTVLCSDDDNCRKLKSIISRDKCITYGLKDEFEPDVLGFNWRNNTDGLIFDVRLSDKLSKVCKKIFCMIFTYPCMVYII